MEKFKNEKQANYLKIYLADTASANSPIKVLSAKTVEKEYSNYKDIRLTWKNVSLKTVSAIRFSWVGLNAFGELAEMGGVLEGKGAGFTDNPLRSGKTQTATFEISSKDLKKIMKAWANEVVFEDGTKWKSGNDK